MRGVSVKDVAGAGRRRARLRRRQGRHSGRDRVGPPPRIAVPAGLADRAPGHEEPRPRQVALRHALADAPVGAARVADGREAAVESIASMRAAPRAVIRVSGIASSARMFTAERKTCTWQSISPGTRVRPPASSVRVAETLIGRADTSRIRSPSTTTEAFP
jgi:hypothetical protein